MRSKTLAFALAIFVAFAASLALVWQFAPVADRTIHSDSTNATSATAVEYGPRDAPNVPAPGATAPDDLPPEALFDKRNLYADFQAAIGSTDARTLERGIEAWDTCAGYVDLGVSDINELVSVVMPPGLDLKERQRRERYVRLDAQRCLGFAMQHEAAETGEQMRQAALEKGSLHERIRRASAGAFEPGGESSEMPRVACEVVRQYPESGRAIRHIAVAMILAAARRQEHMLNRLPMPARSLAVSLALCELHPEGCTLAGSRHNVIASACVQRGRCSYRDLHEYFQAERKAEDLDAANGLRKTIVEAVRSADCAVLF